MNNLFPKTVAYIRVCIRCEKEYVPKTNRKTKYCSRACSDQNTVAVCYCKTCGNRFEARHIRKYCNTTCDPNRKRLNLGSRICVTCGKEYQPRLIVQKHCSRACNPYNKNRQTYYQSKEWKETRKAFVNSFTMVNGIQLSNKYCIRCYVTQNRLNDMYAVDHTIPRCEGGSDDHSNLQSLCKHHHQSKSATEGNKRRYAAQR